MPVAPGRGELVGDLVRVHDLDAQRAKGGRDRRLAAPDAAGEADDERHRRYMALIAGPKNSATAPAPASQGP